MNRIIYLAAFAPIFLPTSFGTASAQEQPPPTPPEQSVADRTEKLNSEGERAFRAGRYAEANDTFRQLLEIYQRLYPASSHPAGHPDIANTLDNLSSVMQSAGSYDKALPYAEQAVAMFRRLYPEEKYPDGQPDLAKCLANLGQLWQATGGYDKALPYQEQALAMRKRLYPPVKYPDGHSDIAESLTTLGVLFQARGSLDKAASYFEQAVAMYRKLYPVAKYPDGNVNFAKSLGNLGAVLRSLSSFDESLKYFKEALAMREKLFPAAEFPNGHPDLARNLNALGALLVAMGRNDQALPFAKQAVEMYGKLYPTAKYPAGHPEFASSINNLAALFVTMGKFEEATPLYQRATDMLRRKFPVASYPNGHPDLARSINTLCGLWHALGNYEQALKLGDEALAMYRALGRQILATSTETDALAFLNFQPRTRDGYLSLTTHVPNAEASAYRSVWFGKSAVTRVLEQRHAAARIAGTENFAKLEALKSARRQVDRLLQDRQTPLPDREKLLAKAADDCDKLERELAVAVPLLQRSKELDLVEPDALIACMPEHAVLIDLIRYAHFEFDKNKRGKDLRTVTPTYAAFVVSKNSGIKRAELDATAIDAEIAKWRRDIDNRVESPSAGRLRDILWEKLARCLPPGTNTIYLSPDGELGGMPWAALPIADNKVLLDDFAFAIVPHGPFLMEALKFPRIYQGADAALLVGGLDYNSQKWTQLPGTVKELNVLGQMAGVTSSTLSKSEASADHLIEQLPKARYAHLATHGYFDIEGLDAQKKREAASARGRQFGEQARARVATANPLAFVGLILSSGQQISGLSLLDLPLENLKLATLSACETGLGETTGSEGVQGLQRALHLAGCPNVVASLWQVNDAATVALMAKFYHELWVNKKPAIEALREAQLTVYYNPELIADLAGERGAPRLNQAMQAQKSSRAEKQGVSSKTTDTKLWASFVLSGAGK